MEFVMKNKAFVIKHDMFLIPDELRARLGALADGQLITDPIETINKLAEMVKSAHSKIDMVTLGLENIIELTRQRCREGIKVRWLIEENFIPKATSLLRSWEQLPEMRSAPSFIGHYGVTETGAILILFQKDGEISFSSFFGQSPSLLKWTEDLFTYEWQKAKPWQP
jgi:predicted transcriptional regulator